MEEVAFPKIELLEELMVKSIKNVFSTMLQQPVEFKARYSKGQATASPFYALGAKDPMVVGSIGFVGEANGVVYLYMHHKMAMDIAMEMTGMEADELTGEFEIVKDVIGEVANMTIGNFKNGICDMGFNCRVTLPTVLKGSQMEVDSTGSARRESFHFEFKDQPLIMDLFLEEAKA